MRTITTVLYQDTPSWIKTIEFSNRLIKWIFMPRIDMKNISKIQIDELLNAWIYFLIGDNEKEENQVYIWQAVDLKSRLEQHNKGKDFWNYAVLFTNKENSLTESDLNYLEKALIEKAKEINRIKIENKTIGNPCLIPNHRKADMKDFLDNLEILLGNLGFLFLQDYKKDNKEKTETEYYHLNARWSDAQGLFTQEGFLVLKGSRWPKELASNMKKNGWQSKREKLISKWIISEQGDDIVFLKDCLFSSPSTWATIIAGNPLNWRNAWKNSQGKTLDQLERSS